MSEMKSTGFFVVHGVDIYRSYFSSFDAKRPYVIANSFAFPYSINGLGVTKTTNGITTREILVGLDDKIHGISKWLLDPRRPIEPSSEDKEEALIPYKPIIDFDPKDSLTHQFDVLGCKHFVAAPTGLESTSIVAAFGLDLFLTRRAPSKEFDLLSESFGRGTLLATMAALFVGILFAKRLVRDSHRLCTNELLGREETDSPILEIRE
jgi:ER membrane protein complex subunit 1